MADDDNGNGDGGSGTQPLQMKAPSECIASLAYNNDEGMVYFTFVRGNKEYSAPISRQQATAWALSDSPGEYFNENIKGKY
jgi:hypothetical protein